MKAILRAGETPAVKPRKGKSRFHKVNAWLHLWLGLVSGVIVFIVCITACIWAFNEEITRIIQPRMNVSRQDKPVLTPSQVQKAAQEVFPGQRVYYADYLQGRAISAGVGSSDHADHVVKLHPYTGELLLIEDAHWGASGFFSFVLQGHRFLWLPYQIGRPLVNYATLVFVLILITGLIWWYPRKWTRTKLKKSFTVRWRASFKRLNIDLHNVFGFYAFLIMLVMALTGVVWGLEWYNRGVYWITSGGKTLPAWIDATSDPMNAGIPQTPDEMMDEAWAKVVRAYPSAEGFYYRYPDTSDVTSVIRMIAYPSSTQFYNAHTFVFDRYTLAPLESDAVAQTGYAGASGAEQLRKMNFDLHVGSILGFPGKVLAFGCSLIGASLPLTGFLIWWGRRKKKKKKQATETRTAKGK